MNCIFSCFKQKKYSLDRLYVCKIFRTNSDTEPVDVKILYLQNSIEEPCYLDPLSGEVCYTLYHADFSKDEFYCEVISSLVFSMRGTTIETLFQKGKLTIEQIKELNSMIAETHNIITFRPSNNN